MEASQRHTSCNHPIHEAVLTATGMARAWTWVHARGHGLPHVGMDLRKSMLMSGAPVLVTQIDLGSETGLYVVILSRYAGAGSSRFIAIAIRGRERMGDTTA
jgi:hypothetical protein